MEDVERIARLEAQHQEVMRVLQETREDMKEVYVMICTRCVSGSYPLEGHWVLALQLPFHLLSGLFL
jgi:hypothetical protein